MTQQYGALLADCRKLASADAADRLLVLVTDRAGATHVANKGLLPSTTGGGPRLVGTTEIERLPASAIGTLSYVGPWIPISVELIWRAIRVGRGRTSSGGSPFSLPRSSEGRAGGVHPVDETSWCYFRCLVQASYREARHIGPPGDSMARCEVTSEFGRAAAQCSRNRARLKGLDLWRSTEPAQSTAEVLAPYVSASGLAPEELPGLFLLAAWQPSYGGRPWSRIAEVMLRLREAIDQGDVTAAETLRERLAAFVTTPGHSCRAPRSGRAIGGFGRSGRSCVPDGEMGVIPTPLDAEEQRRRR